MTAPTITLPLQLKTVPPVMKRGVHALILVVNEKKQFVLGAKDIYPAGIYRLVGGGIEAEENPNSGAARELAEELGVVVAENQLTKLATIVAEISAPELIQAETPLIFTTHLYAAQLNSADIVPSSDLDGLVQYDEVAYAELISRYSQLPESIDPTFGFAWADYGRLYGQIHDIALKQYQQIVLK